MPACNIVRIVCTQEGRAPKYWSVAKGGTLKLVGENEAQCFVTHCETDRSCLIQHLQSGAFVEQGPNRSLRLALYPASALPFSKLAAYSEGEAQVTRDSIWLRAATGGIVCSNSQDELAVAVNGQCQSKDCPARDCSFTFQIVDPQSLLMQGLVSNPIDVHTSDSPPSLQYPHSASVSIAAKPVHSSMHVSRSAAVPIALKRPIRKVSFSDLSAMDQAESYDQKSAPVHSYLPQKGGSFPHSYSLKDAFCNRVPHSPSYSNILSQGSDTDESKVRGGHHFDSDQVSSSDSLSNLEQSLSELPASSTTTLSSPCDTLSSSTQSHTTTHLIPSRTASRTASHTASRTASGMDASHSAQKPPDSPQQHQQDQLHESSDQLRSAWDHLQQSENQLRSAETDSSVADSGLAGSYDSERSSRGCKMHGGTLFKQGGIRSTQSMSAISSTPHKSPSSSHLKGRRTHGSQTALNFLAGNCTPSSPHRVPRTADMPQGLAQSAPVVGKGLLASEAMNLSHGQSHGWSNDAHWPSSSGSPGPRTSPPPSSFPREGIRSLNDSSEGLTALRLTRVSGDSHQREPMLPCIYEGVPSQDPTETLQQSAADTLFSRCGQIAIPLLHNGMKRVSSSPDMRESSSSLHPAIHKVTPRGSPISPPWALKRHHTYLKSCSSFSNSLQV